jgi:hypothetical protein
LNNDTAWFWLTLVMLLIFAGALLYFAFPAK